MKIIKYILLLFLFFTSQALYAGAELSGVYNDGAKIVVTSGAYFVIQGDYLNESSGSNHGAIDLEGTLKLSGDFTNNATSGCGFVNPDSEGDVVLNGSTSLGGSSTADFEFYNLTVEDGDTLNTSTKSVVVHGTANLNGTGFMVTIGSEDMELEGDLTGSGLFNAISTGYLIRTPEASTSLSLPVGDGTSDYQVSLLCESAPTGQAKLKINKDANVTGALTNNMWDLILPTGTNITLTYKVQKSVIDGGELSDGYVFRYHNGTRYVPILQSLVTTTDNGTYYTIEFQVNN